MVTLDYLEKKFKLSRRNENTGDGFHLALKAGCRLSDMEMVQFHPTGMVIPEEIEWNISYFKL